MMSITAPISISLRYPQQLKESASAGASLSQKTTIASQLVKVDESLGLVLGYAIVCTDSGEQVSPSGCCRVPTPTPQTPAPASRTAPPG